MRSLHRIALLFCLLSACHARQAFGQTRVKVSPQSDTAGLPGALVSVVKSGKVIYAAYTDSRGEISHGIHAPYVLQIKSFGFRDQVDTVYNAEPLILIKLKENAHALEDVVVTAQYTPDIADHSVYKIRVIDAEKLRRLAAVNLKDALSNELNFRFSQDNAMSQSSLSLQGISGENVKVLIDGVPMIGRQNGDLDLSQINVNNVERIEVVEGPLSVNYGTNALAGVINIITKKPRKDKLEASAQACYETSHTYNANASVSLSRRNNTFKLNGGRNYFDGWTPHQRSYLLPEKTLADTNRFKSWKPREQYFTGLDYIFEKKKLRIGYKSSYFDETIINRGFPVKPYYETAFDDYYKTKRFDNSASLKLKINDSHSFNTIIAYNYYRRDKQTFYKNLTDLSQQLAADNSLQDTSVFTLAMARGSLISSKAFETHKDTLKQTNRFNYELGYDLNYESALGKRIQDYKKYIGDYALFASSEIRPVKDLVIRPALRYAYNTNYQAPLTPSLNLKFDRPHWIFRASYAKGFRSPTLKELYFDFVDINHNIIGNLNLRAETSNNYNLSYKYRREKSHYTTSFDQAFFYNDIRNLITLGMISGTQYSYINVGRYITYGTSANLVHKYKELSLSVGGSYSARYNSLSETYQVARFNYLPEARASANYTFSKQNITLSAFYKYTGRLPGFSLDAGNHVYQSYTAAYQTLDANVSKQFFEKKFSIAIGAKNIFNVTSVLSNYSGGVHSASSTSSPVSMGRTYFIKLDYAFSK